MLCQVLCKADSKALHAYWPMLFPVQTPLSRRPDFITLMDVMASDPVPKVSNCLTLFQLALCVRQHQDHQRAISMCKVSMAA